MVSNALPPPDPNRRASHNPGDGPPVDHVDRGHAKVEDARVWRGRYELRIAHPKPQDRPILLLLKKIVKTLAASIGIGNELVRVRQAAERILVVIADCLHVTVLQLDERLLKSAGGVQRADRHDEGAAPPQGLSPLPPRWLCPTQGRSPTVRHRLETRLFDAWHGFHLSVKGWISGDFPRLTRRKSTARLLGDCETACPEGAPVLPALADAQGVRTRQAGRSRLPSLSLYTNQWVRAEFSRPGGRPRIAQRFIAGEGGKKPPRVP